MKLHKWSDTLAKSKLSPERRARIEADVEQELLEMGGKWLERWLRLGLQLRVAGGRHADRLRARARAGVQVDVLPQHSKTCADEQGGVLEVDFAESCARA